MVIKLIPERMVATSGDGCQVKNKMGTLSKDMVQHVLEEKNMQTVTVYVQDIHSDPGDEREEEENDECDSVQETGQTCVDYNLIEKLTDLTIIDTEAKTKSPPLTEELKTKSKSRVSEETKEIGSSIEKTIQSVICKTGNSQHKDKDDDDNDDKSKEEVSEKYNLKQTKLNMNILVPLDEIVSGIDNLNLKIQEDEDRLISRGPERGHKYRGTTDPYSRVISHNLHTGGCIIAQVLPEQTYNVPEQTYNVQPQILKQSQDVPIERASSPLLKEEHYLSDEAEKIMFEKIMLDVVKIVAERDRTQIQYEPTEEQQVPHATMHNKDPKYNVDPKLNDRFPLLQIEHNIISYNLANSNKYQCLSPESTDDPTEQSMFSPLSHYPQYDANSLSTGTPSSLSTGTPSPSSTGMPSPLSTGMPSPLSTGTQSPLSTGMPSPLGMGMLSPSTTSIPSSLSMVMQSPLSTGMPSSLSMGMSSPLSTLCRSPTQDTEDLSQTMMSSDFPFNFATPAINLPDTVSWPEEPMTLTCQARNIQLQQAPVENKIKINNVNDEIIHFYNSFNFQLIDTEPKVLRPESRSALERMNLDVEEKRKAFHHLAMISDEKLSVQDNDGDTKLLVMIAQKLPKGFEYLYAIVKRLKDIPGALAARNLQGHSALLLSCMYMREEPLVARFIAESLQSIGHDLNEVYDNGNTVIHWLCERGDEYLNILVELLSMKDKAGLPSFDINKHNHSTGTALLVAVKAHGQNNISCSGLITFLLSQGANVTETERCGGRTSLHIAIKESGDPLIVQILLKAAHRQGKNLVNCMDYPKDTALHYAHLRNDIPIQRQLRIISLLLQHGATNVTGSQGRMPLALVMPAERKEIIRANTQRRNRRP